MSAASIRIDGLDALYECPEDDVVLRAALRAGLPFPYECNSGSCGSCKFELLEGEVESLWPEAPGLSERDRKKNRRLGCQSRANGACRIRFRPDPACVPRVRPRRFTARFAARRRLTHDMAEFRFMADVPAEFLPGQYALLRLPEVVGLRAYSMSNLPNREGAWEFQIKNFPGGAGSRALFERLETGAPIELDGPYGMAYLREDAPRDIVCIAGGSGMAPMIAIARGMARVPQLARRRLLFFYGGRGPDDIVGWDVLEELSSGGASIEFHPVISMPELDTQDRWRGPVGFVHEHVGRLLGMPDDFGAYEYYLAGPPPMVDATLKLLVMERKVPIAQIHYDRFY